MTKTKRQLRAEAVERLRNIPNERMNAASVVIAIAGEAAYRLGGTRDARDMCIDLLTDDDSTTELLSDEVDSREKLEADVLKYYTHTVSTAMWPPSANKHTDMVSVSMDDVLGWLDRQAAITANETNHDNPYVGLVRGKQWERTETSDYYCGRCGWKVTDHDSYCSECGGALHKASNKPDSKFDVPKSEETTENSTAKGDIRDFDDTREKLEADVRKWCGKYAYQADMVWAWLNRQAAITEREFWEGYSNGNQWEMYELQRQVDELTTEREMYREKLSRALDLAHEIERLMP